MRAAGGRSCAAGTAAALLLTACGAAGVDPSPQLTGTPSPSPSVSAVVVAADGLALSAFGVTNGPVGAFSLPRSTVVSALVDQPNNVSVVFGEPPADEAYAYLERTLTGAGFRITAQNPTTTTMTFVGYGWRGSFTGDDQASAVLLRPG